VTGPRVLVVDDEPQIRRSLRVTLRANGYEVDEAATGEAALDLAAVHPPLLVILDLSLPDVNGVEVTRRLREWTQLPIVILSVRGDDEAKVRALDAGADDYLTKPFSVPELLARMRVALRHGASANNQAATGLVVSGDVEIDLTRRIVRRGGREVHLTPTEYGLLRFLAQHAERVVTHGQLLRAVLGEGYEEAIGSLRVFITNLRKKLEADPSAPRLIVTEPGVGYRLKLE
jgi:two-component system, OmpR family, KDP operon response regulator KdpE